MSDPVVIVDPTGTEHEFPSGFDPKKAGLIVSRAYGDEQAAAAQKKAEAGSTFASQMTPSNLLHDAGTVAGAGWDVLKTLAKEGWKNPLGINQPDIRYDPAAHAQDPTLGDRANSALGTLRTLPAQAAEFIQHPIDTTVDALQNAGVTPDMAAHAGGTVAALGAVGAALPNAGRLTTSTGNLVTRAGEAMNPAMTKTLGEGVGALAEAGLGGGSGSPTMGGLGRVFAGSKIGGAIGETIPAMTRGTGRLITKAGQFIGSATGTPAGLTPPAPPVQPNTLLSADDLKAMLEEAMTQRDAPTSTTAPSTDVPPVGAGRTEEGLISSGRPAVTPTRYDELTAQAAARRAALEEAALKSAQEEPPLPKQSVVPPPDEAEVAGVPEEADAAPVGATITTPSPAELSPDEIRRKEIGARDFAAEQRRESGGDITETTDEVRARTRARTTGQTGQTSVIPTQATNRIVGKLKDMIASGASDDELRAYLNKAPTDASKKQIGLMLNTLLHGTGRNVVGIGAAAAGGAALRNALVGQLQGDQKDQEQD